MKRFSLIVFALAVFLFNLVLAQPSWADPPSFSKNPDYIEITETLNTLLTTKGNPPEGTNLEEIQKQIGDLEFQKYALETGMNWGQCRNETGKTIAIYGKRSKKSDSTYSNALYFLNHGQTTQYQWDCDGIYVPNDVKISGIDADLSALALKIVDGTQLVVTTNPETGELSLNVPPSKVLKTGEINWFIPDVSQSVIEARIPNAPTREED